MMTDEHTEHAVVTDEELKNELEAVATYGRNMHKSDQRNHCRTCGMRMPCDWADTGETAALALDRIERLETNLGLARAVLQDIAVWAADCDMLPEEAH